MNDGRFLVLVSVASFGGLFAGAQCKRESANLGREAEIMCIDASDRVLIHGVAEVTHWSTPNSYWTSKNAAGERCRIEFRDKGDDEK